MHMFIYAANVLLSLPIIVVLGLGACVPQQDGTSIASSSSGDQIAAPPAPAPSPEIVEDTWPRVFTVGSDDITLYPPNMQSWSGTLVTGTCAFSVAPTGGKTQNYGTMSFTASTEVNKLNRMVTLSAIQITGVSMPTNPAQQTGLLNEIESRSSGKSINIALDRFEASVPNMKNAPSVPSHPLLNNPPALSIVTMPTVLVPVQGTPVLQALPGTSLQRVMNTPMLLVQDNAGKYWLKIADGWMTCGSLQGNWAVGSATQDLNTAAQWAQGEASINLLAPSASDIPTGSDKSQTASLAVSAPAIIVSTTPAEILVTDGAPQWIAAGTSGLLYINNTSANIFQLQATGTVFVLVSGRWFSANTVAGPWSFTPPDQLPGAFMMMPLDCPKENVLASIPGSAQAQEAAIANAVPQMARVPHTQTLPAPTIIGGSPSWQPIQGTSLKVMANCATPIFEVGPGSYYAVQSGIWFTSKNYNGGWTVASWVSPSIYMIPPSSPYYYVTYCHIYSATPDYVLVGYTPGYFGAYMQAGVVVYGTGYVYAPYCSTVWVPVPMTYGCGAAMVYNPWAGWAYGFGMGMAVGWAIGASTWHCGPYPYWGPYYGGYGAHGAAAWGPHGWAATTGNVYHQWGSVSTMNRSSAGYNSWTGNQWSTHTSASYNSATGARAAGQTGHVDNAYTGNWASGARGAGYNPTTGNYAAGKGVVAGTPSGATVAAGAGTVGNTKTGQSVSAAGVKTDNGTWGVAHGDNGTAVSTGNNVYATHDGNAYKYNDSTDSWQQHSGGDNWSNTTDANTTHSLNQQQATRSNGDFQSSNASRYQPGGAGFDSSRTSGGGSSGSTWGNSWGGNRSSGSSSNSSNAGRSGRSGGGGGRR